MIPPNTFPRNSYLKMCRLYKFSRLLPIFYYCLAIETFLKIFTYQLKMLALLHNPPIVTVCLIKIFRKEGIELPSMGTVTLDFCRPQFFKWAFFKMIESSLHASAH